MTAGMAKHPGDRLRLDRSQQHTPISGMNVRIVLIEQRGRFVQRRMTRVHRDRLAQRDDVADVMLTTRGQRIRHGNLPRGRGLLRFQHRALAAIDVRDQQTNREHHIAMRARQRPPRIQRDHHPLDTDHSGLVSSAAAFGSRHGSGRRVARKPMARCSISLVAVSQ